MTLHHEELLTAIATMSPDDLALIAGAVAARRGDADLDDRYTDALGRGDAQGLIVVEMQRAERNAQRAGGQS
jgi:hypothetical protein